MNKLKFWIVLSVIATAIVSLLLLLLFLRYYFSGSTMEEIQPAYDPAVVLVAQGKGCACLDSENNLYSLSKIGKLKGPDTSVMGVSQMLPVGDGLAYLKRGDLYYSLQGESREIAQNVQTFGDYGSRLVYATDGGVYLWDNESSLLLVERTGSLKDRLEDEIRGLVGNEKYLAIMCKSGIFVYQQGADLWEIEQSAPADPVLKGFFYKNTLVLVGAGETGAIAYDLETHTAHQIDLGWPYSDISFDNKISVASDGGALYMSYRVNADPKFVDDLFEFTATFRIDPENWSAELISENYYPNLVYGADGLYALDVFKHRGKLIYSAQ